MRGHVIGFVYERGYVMGMCMRGYVIGCVYER